MKKNTKIIIILCIAIFLILFFTIGVPLIINCAYSTHNPYITTKWSASDVLSYYGSLIATTATIITLVVTVRITNKNTSADYKKDHLILEHEVYMKKIQEFKWIIGTDQIEQQRVFMNITLKESMLRYFSEVEKLSVYIINFEHDLNNNITKVEKDFININYDIIADLFYAVGIPLPEEEDPKYEERYAELMAKIQPYENDYQTFYNNLVKYKNEQLEKRIKGLYSYRIIK